jgi:hypothetical protein
MDPIQRQRVSGRGLVFFWTVDVLVYYWGQALLLSFQ